MALSYHDICIACCSRADCLDISRDRSLRLGVRTPSLRTNQFEIMREQPMACNGTPVGCTGECANDACANENRKVKTVLRVPSGSCRSPGAGVSSDSHHLHKRLRTPSCTGGSEVRVPKTSKSDPLRNKGHGRFKCERWPGVDHRRSTQSQPRIALVASQARKLHSPMQRP
jgi:hypothetical protein